MSRAQPHVVGVEGRVLNGLWTLQSLILFTSSCGQRNLQLKQSSSCERKVLTYVSCNATDWGQSQQGGVLQQGDGKVGLLPMEDWPVPQMSQDWPSNCSRLLQKWLPCRPPGLLSFSASSRSLNMGFPTARPFSNCLAFFFLAHPHNYSSTKSGLVKQQHFKKPQTLISRQSFPPTSSPFKQGCQPCCFFQTFSESSHQAACKYLNATINVKVKVSK